MVMAKIISEAIRDILVERGAPAISAYDLVLLIGEIYASFGTSNPLARVRKSVPSESDISKIFEKLKDSRVIRVDPDFGYGFFQVFDVLEQLPEAVCCSLSPFCYVSHMSSMQIYSVTERNSTKLIITRPSANLWRDLRDKRDSAAPSFSGVRIRESFPEKVRGRDILVHETKYLGEFQHLGQTVRISTYGQMFLDMVVRPSWCGGMRHVLGVWEREAPFYLDEIIKAVERCPIKLPKVRAGYILNEVLKITDERVEAWTAYAQRGSSQKLDPENEFSSNFSEKWMLSLNA